MPIKKIRIPKEADVLLVEDSCERIAWFERKLGNVAVAKNLVEAKDALQHGCPYHVVFLDHDAGLYVCGEYHSIEEGSIPATQTFAPIAERLVELDYHGTVIIHSQNSVGADAMKRTLGCCDVHIAPFGSFDLERA